MKHQILIFLAMILVSSCTLSDKQATENSLVFQIDIGSPSKPLKPFWTATGFSPGEFLLRDDMKQVIKEVGELPDEGLNWIRPHYLLNMVAVEGFERGKTVYNWDLLDEALDVIVENDLRLIFEIMGFPANDLGAVGGGFDDRYQVQLEKAESYFSDLTREEQIRNWKIFVRDLAMHLEDRYGKDVVRSWLFETTNEPDLFGHFWNYDIQTFLNYYDACSEGLLEADPELKFGGPGTARDLSDTFKELLAHCDRGTNFFTGDTGVRLDFISVHVKTLPHQTIERQLKIIDYIRENHPRFAELPFINDEADPLAGWSRPYWWRRGPWYAAYIVQSVDWQYRKIIDSAGVKLDLISNDHTFMGTWEHRTTHARFQNGDDFRLVRQPVLTVMQLMSELKTGILDVDVPDSLSRYFGIIPTVDETGVAILVYNKTDVEILNDSKPKPEPDFELQAMKEQEVRGMIELTQLPYERVRLQHFRIDSVHANPYALWKKMGSPAWPEEDKVDELNEASWPVLLSDETMNARKGTLILDIYMPSSSVSLYLLDAFPN